MRCSKLAKTNHTVRGGPVCVYPEAKSPAYHDAIGHKDMAEKILASLKAHGLDARGIAGVHPVLRAALREEDGGDDRAAGRDAGRRQGRARCRDEGRRRAVLGRARRYAPVAVQRGRFSEPRHPRMPMPRASPSTPGPIRDDAPFRGEDVESVDKEGAGAGARRLLHRLPGDRLSRGERGGARRFGGAARFVAVSIRR